MEAPPTMTFIEKIARAMELEVDPRARRISLPEYPWLDQTRMFDADVFDSGWAVLIQNFLAKLDSVLAGTGARLEARQLKEKFGRLRFYYRLHGVTPEQEAAVAKHYDASEQQSANTCIDCGARGRLRTDRSWFVPLCDRHA